MILWEADVTEMEKNVTFVTEECETNVKEFFLKHFSATSFLVCAHVHYQ